MSDIKKTSSQNPDPHYWQSFEELYNSKEFIELNQNEFKEGVSENIDAGGMSALSRRKFLALLGASAAIAGTSCTDYRDKGEIVPYNKKPEEILPGRPNYYASTCMQCENACGILVRTREGRPIKLDGNLDHPVSKGKICAQGQASIMGLYDPDRLKNPKKKLDTRLIDINWKTADEEIYFELINSGGSEIAIITNKIVSPTTKEVLDQFIEIYPSAKVYSYEPINNEVRNSAWEKCYGDGEYPAIKWNEAKVILSLDSDFLGSSNNKIETARLYAEGRDVMNKNFSRLYTVEGNLSVTGMNSDYRFRLRPDLQMNFILALTSELNKRGAGISLDTFGMDLKNFADENALKLETIDHLVNDLISNKGKAILHAGDHLPEDVHVAINTINHALGNDVLYNNKYVMNSVQPLRTFEEIQLLTSRMKNGDVAVAIHINTNPVYDLPGDFGYTEALKSVGSAISFVEVENETSSVSNYVLPINNQLESWGDAKTRSGFYSMQQPVISPLYDTRQTESILLTWMDGDPAFYNDKVYHSFLIKNWEQKIYPSLNHKLDFNRFWNGALHDGIVITNEKGKGIGSFNVNVAQNIKTPNSVDGFSLQLKESYAVRDGRFANNGWLQELPHPVSKIVWDNYAAISPTSANELGLNSNDLIEVTNGNSSLKIPVMIQPGAADDTITIELGYGRTNGGTVGTGIGFNSFSLFTSKSGLTPFLYSGVNVKKNGGTYKLVTSQTIYAFNEGITKDLPEKRKIIQEGTVNQYSKDPSFIKHENHYSDLTVYPPIEYKGVKWGMAIDMNKCLGCGECVVACNVENNIPVVGKEQVDEGRDMHWLRVDRYYTGAPEEPKVSNQVLICQHCDNAPCENVCPVVATTHSPDGLNQMVYNRCVGTRYCSNNCPYKVRRFNYFNYRDYFKDGYQESPVFALLQNPEVTVRSRGVMEKCTFCVQRISDARAEATKENRELKGSDVKTACQEACGTNAIQFGDINNEKEEFHKYRNHELGYYVLEEINIKPNVTYIARLRNTHSEES
ncbi:MAG: TAT-variant-translocated molybdopterin oxidoreductase [Ignavibacteria bacterium]|nr:TAT-variant-translocated molybdopterin oxidoreductase [Ignavibacteria bacterium]MBT8383702.1 TAT-variant-translocated molybdopterin oxidoreductase [Ignavibacteria bacterium]NNL21380.1 TAT-variant-translocated molybdopterin oxidoreductase [Ignavibacteriaceae bacterium]